MVANKDEPVHTPGVAAEPDRVEGGLVVRFGVILAVLSIVAMLLMAGVFRYLDRRGERRDAAAVDAAGLQSRQSVMPPAPRLEIAGERHWKDFRAAEERRLSTYGWMDRTTGAVHIPIERAMDLIAERGVGPLPNAVPGAPAPTPGASR